jgi:hypothetical protein
MVAVPDPEAEFGRLCYNWLSSTLAPQETSACRDPESSVTRAELLDPIESLRAIETDTLHIRVVVQLKRPSISGKMPP